MRRILVVLAVMALFCLSTQAGDLQRELRDRWLGAWVVLDVESYSNCDGWYTNNRVNGELVRGRGKFSFGAGELAKVYGVDLKRSRLDLMLRFPEPILVSFVDGPFTLYRELHCRVELQYEVSRAAVRRRNVATIERGLFAILERYPSEELAIDSAAWNGRTREPYPHDYELTLARHAAWKAERYNAAVDEKIVEANDVALRLGDRITSDPDYLGGFAEGVEVARSADVRKCSQLMAVSLTPARPKTEDEAEARHYRGVADGKHFVWSLEMMRTLPGCYVEVPEVPSTVEAGVVRRSTDDQVAASD